MPLLQLTNASSPKICSGVVLTGGHGRQAAFGRHIHTRAGRQSYKRTTSYQGTT